MFLLVLLQAVWLLPTLDARVEINIQGGSPPSSALHTLYIGVDLLKLAGLISFATGAFKRLLDADRFTQGDTQVR